MNAGNALPHHLLLELDALGLVHRAWKVEAEEVSAHSNTHGQFVLSQLRDVEVCSLLDAPVFGVSLLVRFIAVIVSNDLVEESGELVEIIGRHGVAA